MKIKLDPRKTVFENANEYYERAKRLKKKLDGAREALANAEAQSERIKEEQILEVRPVRREKRKWYEKFRWFFTSEGLLVVAGKDASSNEVLIKRYMEMGDLVFHADIHGAPFALLRSGGKAVSEASINETAQFAAAYSKAWRIGFGSVDVYWVKPDQVSKQAPAGEHIGKGAFMIRGRKSYLRNVPLRIAIGNREGEAVPGVPSSVRQVCDKFVVVEPGETGAKQLSEQIRRKIGGNAEDMARLLPAGRGKLAQKA